jgi:hypothetical protein
MTHCPEPTRITQGERVEWTRYFSDYPATLWTLQYRFRGPSTGFNIDATADGTSFDVVLPVSNTATMAVTSGGVWKWQAVVEEIASPTNQIVVDSGSLTVTAGFAEGTTTPIDARTANEIALAALDAAINGSTSVDVLEYEISTPAGSRRIKKMLVSERIKWRNWYALRVRNERRRANGCGNFLTQIRGTIRDD